MMNLQQLVVSAFVALLSCGGTSVAQSEPERFVGRGRIVAFQKYDRHRKRPYQRGLGTFVEEWIVYVDKWYTGNRSAGYFLVDYTAVSLRALSDREMTERTWNFSFREPRWHEAESCAGMAPVPSKEGNVPQQRPATIEDFQRTQIGQAGAIPPLKELACLIVEKLPESVALTQH
jgi:hypothetical protein